MVINDGHRLAVSISLSKIWLNSVFLQFRSFLPIAVYSFAVPSLMSPQALLQMHREGDWELIWVRSSWGGFGGLVLTKAVLRFGSPHLQGHCLLIDCLHLRVCRCVFPLRGALRRGGSDFGRHLTVNVELLCLWSTSSPLLFTLRCSLPTHTGIQKREAINCRKIRHFENRFAMETLICEQ